MEETAYFPVPEFAIDIQERFAPGCVFKVKTQTHRRFVKIGDQRRERYAFRKLANPVSRQRRLDNFHHQGAFRIHGAFYITGTNRVEKILTDRAVMSAQLGQEKGVFQRGNFVGRRDRER